jgi:hypothetical protein
MFSEFARLKQCFLSAILLIAHSADANWPEVEPVLSAKCYECHGGAKKKGSVDLKSLAKNPDVASNFDLWIKVRDSVDAGDMPPPKAKPLSGDEGARITGWVARELDKLAEANAGDPGPVTMRRLTNSEYERTIRDLTGHDYGLAAEFQTDGGGGEGFANTGDVLFLSPAALDKYFGAARALTEHATIMPGTGIVFHKHRIGLRGPEQVKAHAEQGLYVWYQQKAGPHLPKDFDDMREGDYMLACWKHRHFKTPLDQLANEAGLQPPFLQNWWNLVNGTEPKSRFLDLTRVAWRELPGPDSNQLNKVPSIVTEKIAQIESDLLSWNNPKKPGSGIQRRQQDADGIRPFSMSANTKGHSQVHLCIGDDGDGNAGDIALIKRIEVHVGRDKLNYLDWLKKELESGRKSLSANPPPAKPEDLKSRIDELQGVLDAFGRHPQSDRKIEPHVLALAAPRVFTLPLPRDAHHVRAETWLDLENPDIDQATIQWEMTTGTPRDMTRILPGVLTVWKIQTKAHHRTMSDFSVMKTAFPDMFERRLEQVAINLYRGSPGISVYYFSDEQLSDVLGAEDRAQLQAMKKDWRCVSQSRLSASQREEYDGAMIWHLHAFASRAWRRPLTDQEKDGVAQMYRDGLAKNLDRETAAREVLVRLLVSPHFLFKAETLPARTASITQGDRPLSPWELASRLSYFLWSSMPDDELRHAAADSRLSQADVLTTQARRMLRDPRSSALAEEFAGQWLKFDGFEAHKDVDLAKFPEFTPELRADLHREATEFFTRLVREDRNVAEIITGKTTFLNERLAKFYKVPGVTGGAFREVPVAEHHRGGLLGMGAILTKTSRAHRTSPVIRGDYLYQVVLGFSSPPPPPNVPKLEENGLKPASLREALKRHREDQACSVCHDRIDPLGFALESFDPVGRFRATDDAGGRIDDTGELRDGTTLKGIDGLRTYLTANADHFTAQFCRKLLGYALGRAVLPSDKKLLAKMGQSLKANAGHFSAAVLDIVTSRQFLNRRGESAVASNN